MVYKYGRGKTRKDPEVLHLNWRYPHEFMTFIFNIEININVCVYIMIYVHFCFALSPEKTKSQNNSVVVSTPSAQTLEKCLITKLK